MDSALNRKGQALVEYILVLVVVVGIVLGAIYQLNSAFKYWAENYFGDYLTCLLETGELPGLGADENSNSECAQLYKEFSAASLLDGKAGSKGDGTDGSGDGSDGGGAAKAPSTNLESGGAASNSRNFASGNGTSSRFSSRSGEGDESGEDGIERDESNIGAGAVSPIDYNSQNGRPRRIALDRSGYGRGAKDRKDKEKDKVKAKKKVEDETNKQVIGPKLVPINRSIASNVEAPEITPMGFGGFLRYLIMAAIFIAIIIFIGGQAVQVSKSMD